MKTFSCQRDDWTIKCRRNAENRCESHWVHRHGDVLFFPFSGAETFHFISLMVNRQCFPSNRLDLQFTRQTFKRKQMVLLSIYGSHREPTPSLHLITYRTECNRKHMFVSQIRCCCCCILRSDLDLDWLWAGVVRTSKWWGVESHELTVKSIAWMISIIRFRQIWLMHVSVAVAVNQFASSSRVDGRIYHLCPIHIRFDSIRLFLFANRLFPQPSPDPRPTHSHLVDFNLIDLVAMLWRSVLPHSKSNSLIWKWIIKPFDRIRL